MIDILLAAIIGIVTWTVAAEGAVQWQHVEQVAPKVPRWRYRETLGYVRTIDKNFAALKRQR